MSPRTRYVEIPADRLVAELEEIGAAIRRRGGETGWTLHGREKVYQIDLRPSFPMPTIMVYTTVPAGGATARDCGEDAVRIVTGVRLSVKEFRPTAKAVKILRTAPRNAEDRVGAFLARLRQALRDAYAKARVVTPCPECGAVMTLRKRRSDGAAFLGCTDYPRCKGTRAIA